MYKIMLAIIGTVFLTVGLSSNAVAGEITGNGKWIAGDEDAPLKGKSDCAYSGREDEPESGEFKGSITQAWGQLPKEVREFLVTIGLHPGDACNPTKAEGGEPDH
jgi:hypothetical protein